jgi:hypothetical protein
MNIKLKTLSLAVITGLLAGLGFQGCSVTSKSNVIVTNTSDTTRSIAPYFTYATKSKKTPDSQGFIQRWLLLEPIKKPNSRNNVFTDSYLRKAFSLENFPNKLSVLPKDGEKVKIGEQELTWHAMESTNFNVKLFRYAYGLRKQYYGVIFWAVTVVNSPQEMKNVRIAVGSNAASMWWFNGTETALLPGDIHMVVDYNVSRRLTLNKGKNIIMTAVINGPGMSDFCVRFLNEKGEPIKDLTITCE